MKKVLHILNGLGSGGAEAFAINALASLEKEDIKIDFLIRTKKGNIYLDKVQQKNSNVIIAPDFPKAILKNFFYMKKFFEGDEFDYDIVHIHANSLVYMIPIYLLCKIDKFKRVKIILHSHNTQANGQISKMIHLYNKKKLDETNIQALACSDLAGKWMFKDGYEVIENGVNLNDYKFNPSIREQIRKNMNVSKREILIGNVGRLTNQKNHMYLLSIFKELAKKHSNYKLLLIGDGELKKEIEDKIKEYNLDEKVIMTGAVTNVNEMYQAMDIFVMTSYYEGLPVSLIEAQASGLRIIVPSEAVGEDANILGEINYLSLQDRPDDWILEIEKQSTEYTRDISLEKIEEAGFGLLGLGEKLYKIYEC